MKKVFAREELCINCRLCEVYCKTAHSKSKDVVKAYKSENPEPVSRISVLAIGSLPLRSIAAIVMTLHVLRLALQAQ